MGTDFTHVTMMTYISIADVAIDISMWISRGHLGPGGYPRDVMKCYDKPTQMLVK